MAPMHRRTVFVTLLIAALAATTGMAGCRLVAGYDPASGDLTSGDQGPARDGGGDLSRPDLLIPSDFSGPYDDAIPSFDVPLPPKEQGPSADAPSSDAPPPCGGDIVKAGGPACTQHLNCVTGMLPTDADCDGLNDAWDPDPLTCHTLVFQDEGSNSWPPFTSDGCSVQVKNGSVDIGNIHVQDRLWVVAFHSPGLLPVGEEIRFTAQQGLDERSCIIKGPTAPAKLPILALAISAYPASSDAFTALGDGDYVLVASATGTNQTCTLYDAATLKPIASASSGIAATAGPATVRLSASANTSIDVDYVRVFAL
jgi:hypothetical protein